MHKTQLYLEDAQYLILKDWAAKQHKSIAQMVRELLNAALNKPAGKSRDPLHEIIGAADSGLTNIAEKADEYLYGDKETIRGLEKESLLRDSSRKTRRKK